MAWSEYLHTQLQKGVHTSLTTTSAEENVWVPGTNTWYISPTYIELTSWVDNYSKVRY